MTTPLSASRIDDLLSELQLLEEKPASSEPISFISVAPPQIKKEIIKEVVKEALPAPKARTNFALTAVCSLLFFALGLFAADVFVTENEELPVQGLDMSGFHPLIAGLQGQFENLVKERHMSLTAAFDESRGDLNKIAMDSRHLISLALLNSWHTLGDESLRSQFIDLAEKMDLGAYLPAQISSEENSRPLYYYSDSRLHLNLTDLHKNILHDIP